MPSIVLTSPGPVGRERSELNTAHWAPVGEQSGPCAARTLRVKLPMPYCLGLRTGACRWLGWFALRPAGAGDPDESTRGRSPLIFLVRMTLIPW